MQANFRTPITPHELTDADFIDHIQGSKLTGSKVRGTMNVTPGDDLKHYVQGISNPSEFNIS